ncbi:NAD(P)/FAD-dependent oxidoreductase [Anaerocolumna sp. MB42-C2]|uniref:NAD(P)/FAD-dependent oxidoreductase n=1 Tax=Anaerocolumna sp. MB42-C2 TaxID=3070997 RepID=UPI0027DFE48A|nr:NAD(P)/FAD-dependent oxidoreductase [Anaerocolumna sp. MB42-C2]WMJ88232.1 NAD(P)/FAD-dependent oxidoreductase [Anaerocolumna sp. MB42-C2]
MLDVIIIGAGVVGCAIARELSRYQLKILVLDKESDVCEGTSKANSAIVHAGYDAKAGSLKAKLNVEGNKLMEDLSHELDFAFRRNGSLVLCFQKEEREQLEKLLDNGLKNGVTGLKILEKEEIIKMEPNITDEVCAALYAPTGGIVCPFNLTIALAENAFVNGVEFKLNTEVMDIKKIKGTTYDNCYKVKTKQGEFDTKIIINAAGVYADKFHNMVSEDKMLITARKGEYCLLDKTVGNFVNKTVFQLPNKYGKGVLVTPTIHGNLLIGPTALDIQDKELINTTADALNEVIKKAEKSVNKLPANKIITSFAGLRAHTEQEDFIIEEVKDAPGFIDVAGIESPGLSSAPAIGRFVEKIVLQILPSEKKVNFISHRKGVMNPLALTYEEREEFIKKYPAYANVICRCETVTEGEIMDAINRPLGADTLDGIKRRTRAGSGRCQAGFCLPKTMSILARELHVDRKDITKCGGKSNILLKPDMD